MRAPASKRDLSTRRILTTTDAARVCRVAVKTICNWIDHGLMPGCYRLPGSHDRRIPREALLVFLKRNDMPGSDLLTSATRVLLVGVPLVLGTALADLLPHADLPHVTNGFDAGLSLARQPAGVVVVDVGGIGRETTRHLACRLASWDVPPRLVALCPEDDALAIVEGYEVCLGHPVDPQRLAEVLFPEEEEE